ncbi:MAG: peptidoglycan-binding protein [Christensenellaceae bacterium]
MFKKIVSIITVFIAVLALSPISALAVERYEVLQVGDEDKWVVDLQKKLNTLDYLKVPATGYFGTDTQNAVVKFQQDSKINADGKAGPATRKLLFGDNFSEIDSSRTVSSNSTSKASEQTTAKSNKANVSADTLNPGDKGDQISELQTKLKELEYYEYANITGYYGPVTEDAVKKFQRTNDITVDGVMGTGSLELLNSDKAKYYMMYPGDSGNDIKTMQEQLSKLGYFNANATGYYGPVTEDSVKLFQAENNLTVDGKVGKNTRKVLFSDDAIKGKQSNNKKPVASPTTAPDVNAAPQPTEQPPAQSDANANPTPTAPPAEQESPPVATQPASTGVQRFIEIANSQMGKPYSYGSNGPNSFDCSGFVYYCLKNSGVATSRLSSAGFANTSGWASVSDVNSLVVGDLVFFKSDSSDVISHMGIYLGGGSIIHAAPSSGGVSVSTMSSGYYSRNYISAKRVF